MVAGFASLPGLIWVLKKKNIILQFRPLTLGLRGQSGWAKILFFLLFLMNLFIVAVFFYL